MPLLAVSQAGSKPTSLNTRRRSLLKNSLALASAASAGAWAQPLKTASLPPWVIAQIVDVSLAQQDVSKDFLTGSRTAWQEINARGGLRGKKLQHLVLETDGTAPSLRSALNALRDNPACLALSGSAGDALAQSLARLMEQDKLPLAHLAPWLHSSEFDADGRTFSIFASQQEQIQHALKSLALMGMTEIGAVYASPSEHTLYRAEIERLANNLKLQARHFPATQDLKAIGQSMGAKSPVVLLFLGGTPELAQFTQGLEAQSRQRYIVALADVNLQTMLQMGAARKTPVIATQVVPVLTSNLPVVRSFRESLARYFDEAPTALSLAGYIAARASFDLMASVEGPISRASLLAASQRSTGLDVGGFQISLAAQKRTSAYVTQSMLTADGRVLG